MQLRNVNPFITLVTLISCSTFVGCGGSNATPTTSPATTPAETPAAIPATDAPAATTTATETPAEAVDPHDIPLTEEEIAKLKAETTTYAAAMEHITTYRDTIRDETTKGEAEKAHRSLDNVDYVLQWLPEVAQNSNVPKEQWQTVGENAQKLRDSFNQVHGNIDAGKPPEYEKVAVDVDSAMTALEGVAPAQ